LLKKEKFFFMPFYQNILPLKNHFTDDSFLSTALTMRKLCGMAVKKRKYFIEKKQQ